MSMPRSLVTLLAAFLCPGLVSVPHSQARGDVQADAEASVVVGCLWDRFGTGHIPLALGAGFSLAAALWLLAFMRPERHGR